MRLIRKDKSKMIASKSHRILLIVAFLAPLRVSALEGTRDWSAFEGFNDRVNEWLSPSQGIDQVVAARRIKMLFFKFWLMYYGPSCYTDDEAKAVKPFIESKLKTARKKIDFKDTDILVELRIGVAGDQQSALDYCPSLKTMKVQFNDLKVGELKKIVGEFEKWFSGTGT